MKKILTLFVAAFILLTPFSGCGKTKTGTIRLNEVTHSVFYAPLYVAMEMGFFDDYKIELTNGGGADKSMTALISGSADVALMGPETVIYVYKQGKKDYPKVFGQLTIKDGSFLMGRTQDENFNWDSLDGKEIIAGRKGGVPAMTLEYVVNKHNLKDGVNITLNYDIQFNMTASAFAAGTGDYVTVFEPTASQMQSEGKGYVLASVGKESGDLPYTSFIANQSYLNDNQNTIDIFLKGIKKGYDYIYSHTEKEVAEVIVKQFPSTTLNLIESSIKSYKSISAWKSDLKMTEDAFDRLQNIMINAGELETKMPFENLTDSTFVNKL